jgi:hypothetical protein
MEQLRQKKKWLLFAVAVLHQQNLIVMAHIAK